MSAWYRTALFFSIVIHVSRSNYQVLAVQLWAGCTKFYNQTRSQSRNEINTHTEHLVQKTQWFALTEKKLFGPSWRKKQGDKKEKLTESLHLTVKIARRSNYNIDLRKLRENKSTGRRNHKAALNEKPTDSPQWFFIRSSIWHFSFEDKGTFVVKGKECLN